MIVCLVGGCRLKKHIITYSYVAAGCVRFWHASCGWVPWISGAKIREEKKGGANTKYDRFGFIRVLIFSK
jgi:hypothetical protein